MRYAGSHNFVGTADRRLRSAALPADATCRRKRWPRWRAILRRAGLCIKVFDCYRPVRAVANFVRWARDLNDTVGKPEFYPGRRQAHAVPRRLYLLALRPFARLDHRSDAGAHRRPRARHGYAIRLFQSAIMARARQASAIRQRKTALFSRPRCSAAACAPTTRNGGTSRCAASRFPTPISIFRCDDFSPRSRAAA